MPLRCVFGGHSHAGEATHRPGYLEAYLYTLYHILTNDNTSFLLAFFTSAKVYSVGQPGGCYLQPVVLIAILGLPRKWSLWDRAYLIL